MAYKGRERECEIQISKFNSDINILEIQMNSIRDEIERRIGATNYGKVIDLFYSLNKLTLELGYVLSRKSQYESELMNIKNVEKKS